MNNTNQQNEITAWKAIIAKYQKPHFWRATWQIINSIGSYVGVWTLMYFSIPISWWLTLPLIILAAGFHVRIFIIFHDCGHNSFFQSRRANDFWGFITGMLTFTPYYYWRWQHSIHHRTTGDLDQRGTGDIWTLTVQEYLESSRWKRFSYRLARNPIVLFVIAPLFVFLVVQRFQSSKKANTRERLSVWWMNLALLIMVSTLIWIYGIGPYLFIQLTSMSIAGAAGIWLFYIQHQIEDAYWVRGENWDYTSAALKGSSFYKLPKILQWFSGNIGFHHVHHLSTRIPNYNLEKCHHSDPLFKNVEPVTLFSSLKSLTMHLWDESTKKLVGFKHIRKQKKDHRKKKPPIIK
jgi:acyl-lipid omega-6 desaturase (Delta-12 desaturase)